jgi:hypothetical protein
LVNPGPQQTDLFARKGIALLGHARDVLTKTGDNLNEQARRAPARHKGGSRITAFERGSPLIQTQAGLLFLSAVTFDAIDRQQGSNVILKVNVAGDGGRQSFGIYRSAQIRLSY